METNHTTPKGIGKGRKTLGQIQHIPEPKELYEKLMNSLGWPYKINVVRFHCRDLALVALLYLADLRIIEVLPLIKENFENKPKFVWVKDIVVGKKRQGKTPIYREAKLPITGERKVFTDLILQYLEYLEPKERLFPWSMERTKVQIKNSQYKLKDGTIKNRYSCTMVGTKRAWQIVNNLLPEYTAHWLRAFGYNFDYDNFHFDIMAVTDKTKADPRSLQPYLRRRYEKYPVR